MLLVFAANPRMVGVDPLTFLSTTDFQGRSVRMKPPLIKLMVYIFSVAVEEKQGFAGAGSAERYHRASLKWVTR